jgi:hypothetical protein
VGQGALCCSCQQHANGQQTKLDCLTQCQHATPNLQRSTNHICQLELQ